MNQNRLFLINHSIFILAIQELQSNITQLMKQRDEAQLHANEKDRQLSELRREVNNVIGKKCMLQFLIWRNILPFLSFLTDKKKRLEHELERLKQHLVQVEETYTQEALEAEERERELRKKLQVIWRIFWKWKKLQWNVLFFT